MDVCSDDKAFVEQVGVEDTPGESNPGHQVEIHARGKRSGWVVRDGGGCNWVVRDGGVFYWVWMKMDWESEKILCENFVFLKMDELRVDEWVWSE